MPSLFWKASAAVAAKTRYKRGATSGSARRKAHPTRNPIFGPKARLVYVYSPPAEGICLASWPTEFAMGSATTRAKSTESGKTGPAKLNPTKSEKATAAAGAMCVIDWNSTCAKPMECSCRWSNLLSVSISNLLAAQKLGGSRFRWALVTVAVGEPLQPFILVLDHA